MRFSRAFDEDVEPDRQLLGGKAASLVVMTRMGLPVPSGFVVTTEAFHEFSATGGLTAHIVEDIQAAVRSLEQATKRGFGSAENPLLVSVRSGAAVSMPGMMDTILNVGFNDETLDGLIRVTRNEAFALDAYNRFIRMFARTVFGVAVEEPGGEDRPGAPLGDRVADLKRDIGCAHATLYSAGKVVPVDPHEQLHMAIEAVFASWHSPRARDYRRVEGISEELGTAVTVQQMVFGNRDGLSGTGVVFTRNPSTGERKPFGDFLAGAQGEDVVAGRRMTSDISQFAATQPASFKVLEAAMATLESHYRDMVEIEFTVDCGVLHILQSRVGKRTADAEIRIAVDQVAEGLIDERIALQRVRLLAPGADVSRDPTNHAHLIGQGLGASPGRASGRACLDPDMAATWADAGHDLVLVRRETSPEDLHGMIAAKGVLTARGGLASHAAVIARGWGKPAVCGVEQLRLLDDQSGFTIGQVTIRVGDVITIDGTSGEVFVGDDELAQPRVASLSSAAEVLLSWADRYRTVKVFAAVDNLSHAGAADPLGADGIYVEVGALGDVSVDLRALKTPIIVGLPIFDTRPDGDEVVNGALGDQLQALSAAAGSMQPQQLRILIEPRPLSSFPRALALVLDVFGGTAAELTTVAVPSDSLNDPSLDGFSVAVSPFGSTALSPSSGNGGRDSASARVLISPAINRINSGPRSRTVAAVICPLSEVPAVRLELARQAIAESVARDQEIDGCQV